MKRIALIAALVAAVGAGVGAGAVQPAWAQSKGNCYSPNAIEADQAIRFMTDLMVVSSACQNTTYAEFRLRNKDPIIAYQKAMITHFRGAPAFDKWNTALANQYSHKQSSVPPGQFCQQSEPLLKQASVLDPKGFRAFASAQANAASAHYAKCGK